LRPGDIVDGQGTNTFKLSRFINAAVASRKVNNFKDVQREEAHQNMRRRINRRQSRVSLTSVLTDPKPASIDASLA